MHRFLNRLTLLILIIIIAQLLLFRAFPKTLDSQVPAEIDDLQKYTKQPLTILYFGDSTAQSSNPHEKDTRFLTQILSDSLPGVEFRAVTHPAYHAGVYLEFARYLERANYRPKYVIFPVNLRSFSLQWDQRPEYQFGKEGAILSPEEWLIRPFLRPLSVFKFNGLSTIRRDYYENLPVLVNGTTLGKVKDFYDLKPNPYSEKNAAGVWGMLYLYQLTPQHRKVKELIEAVRVLKSENIIPIVYISPIDYQTGEKYWGKQFSDRVDQNIEVIKSAVTNQGVPVLDLAISLPSADFDWEREHYPNEHLLFRGREFVAEKIIGELGQHQQSSSF